ncbi:MAG: PilZ domain-containing protein [Sterolibacterium sp.]|nr:PilZ domain-containing protein [Sterolibacterium sp.]
MEDNRKSPRYPIRWRSAIVVEGHGKPETIQCRTNDISISGVSVICHRNISAPHAVTVYLLIDPGNENHPQVIVEAQGSIMNNVLSGQQGGFRLGIQFTKFAGDGKQVLLKYLPKDSAPAAKRTLAPDVATPVDSAPAADKATAPDKGLAAGEASGPDVTPIADETPATDEAPTANAASAADEAPTTPDTR